MFPQRPESPARDFNLPAQGRGSIRVLIEGGSRKLAVFAPSGARLSWLKSDSTQGEERFSAGELRITFQRGKFHIAGPGNSPFSGFPAFLRLSPENRDSPLAVNEKSYRGSLIFSLDGEGIQCVNALPIEEYLRGVVPLEMGRTGEGGLEALKAQAVVARTYALKYMLAQGSAAFDVRASVQDQVYEGVHAENALSDRAVQQTSGRVVLNADTLALCYYHSTCGGVTAARNEVWGGPVIPYLITRPDRDSAGEPWCAASRYIHWTETWDAADLAVILRRNLVEAGVFSAPAFRRLKDFQVRNRFADGRIDTLEIRTDRGVFDLHGDKIRLALKTSNGRMLPSARFDIEMKGDEVIARGSGYGHGVGMCQVGALPVQQRGRPMRKFWKPIIRER